jgi:UV DNA damage endonuclease
MRFGLCCLFLREPVRFRTTTVKALSRLPRTEQLNRLSDICLHNTRSLLFALETVQRLGIGAFRIMSPLFPRMTHPEAGYRLDDLPEAAAILQTMAAVREYRRRHDIRLSFHPDQFVVLSSPRPEVVVNSVRELEYLGWLSELAGAEVINLHGGGVYGDKSAALARFRTAFALLP